MQEKEIPIARTLIVINFDKPMVDEKIKKMFQLLGKVRKVVSGHYKNKAKNTKFRNVYFSLVVYKNEFDLIKTFDTEYFQSKIDDFFKFDKLKQDEEGKNTYLKSLLSKYEVKKNLVILIFFFPRKTIWIRKKQRIFGSYERRGFKL